MIVGPETAKLVIIAGNATGEMEPFSSPAGDLYKQLLEASGTNPERVAFGWPEDVAHSMSAEYVVLAGNDALQAVHQDLNVGWCHGRAMRMTPAGGTLTFPTFHPEAFYRNPLWRNLLVQELHLLRQLAADRENWLRYVPDTCVRCRGEFHMVDDHGVTFCEKHWGRKLQEPVLLTHAELCKVFDVTVPNL